jgi:hypothetical protein
MASGHEIQRRQGWPTQSGIQRDNASPAARLQPRRTTYGHYHYQRRRAFYVGVEHLSAASKLRPFLGLVIPKHVVVVWEPAKIDGLLGLLPAIRREVFPGSEAYTWRVPFSPGVIGRIVALASAWNAVGRGQVVFELPFR